MPDKVTSLDLKLAHEEWRRERKEHQQALSLWADWYKSKGGPEQWRDFADMIRRRNAL